MRSIVTILAHNRVFYSLSVAGLDQFTDELENTIIVLNHSSVTVNGWYVITERYSINKLQ